MDTLLPDAVVATSLSDLASPWGTPQQRAKQRRNKYDALLVTAAAAFKQQGFALAALDPMAAQLGITKPTLYYYVPSKAQLVQSCAREGYEKALAAVQRAKTLQAALKAYAQVVATDFGWCMVRAEEYALPDAMAGLLRQQRKALEQALRPHLPAGLQAAVLLRAVEGVALHLPLSQLQSLLDWLPVDSLSTAETVDAVGAVQARTADSAQCVAELRLPAQAQQQEAMLAVPTLPLSSVAVAVAVSVAAEPGPVPLLDPVTKPKPKPKPKPKSSAAAAPARRKPGKALEQISLF